MNAVEPIERVADQIERRIRERPGEGLLPHDQVEALDVVYHALVFDRHPRGLELWREALWQRTLPGEARQAVVGMLEHLTAAVARGEAQAASRVCDCLQVFVDAIVAGGGESGTPAGAGEGAAALQ